MNVRRSLSLLAAAALLLAPALTVTAQKAPDAAVTLKVGDPAPPLQVGKWIKGEPVKELEKGKIYVMEFWATWCGPCIAAMPHVTELQAKYKDKGVQVIGVNVWERDLSAPEPFVKKMGDKMGYSVVMDDTSAAAANAPANAAEPGKMASTWMKAAGRNGIPCSFLIDREGKVAWIGHPMQMDRPLAAIVENRFDAAAEAKHEAQLQGLYQEFSTAMRAKDNAKALGVLDELAKLNPDMADQYNMARLGVLVNKGDYDVANKLAAKLGDAKGDRANHAAIANTLLSASDPSKIDAALALKLAGSAYEANGKQGWQYQSLLAKAHAANKEYDKAVELQTKALEQAPEQIKSREEEALASYKQKAGK